MMINKDGISCLIRNNKLNIPKKNIERIAKYFDIDIRVIDRTKEQSYISAIIEAFQFTDCCSQFSIDKYRIDLYFSHYKIAVECDENNHNCRDIHYELERQQYIERHLNCTFVRFNPDDPNFSIYKIISDITKIILSIEKEWNQRKIFHAKRT